MSRLLLKNIIRGRGRSELKVRNKFGALSMLLFMSIFCLCVSYKNAFAITAADCRNCHGQSLVTRHHNLVQSKGKQCLDCHSVVWNATDGQYEIAEFRDCVFCHIDIAKNPHTCVTCHSIPKGQRRAITPEFSLASHHVSTSVQPNDCQACHDISKHKSGTVYLKSYDPNIPGPIAYTDKNVLTGFCLGCHSDKNKTFVPYTDGKTPISSSFNWDGKTIEVKYNNAVVVDSNKYPPTQIAPGMDAKGWKYNTVPNQKKALSPHANPALNEPNGNSSDKPVPCIDCHNAHGSSLAPLLHTEANYAPTSIEDFCWDCHLNDTNSPLKAANYLSGDKVDDYWGGFRWGENAGKGFKDDWMGAFPYKNRRFMSSHFYPSKNKINDTTWPRNPITCTSCHDPHGVDPAQANAQYMVPLLRGTWLISPWKEDRPPLTSYKSGMVDKSFLNPTGVEEPGRIKGIDFPRSNPDLDYNNPPNPGGGYYNSTGGIGHEGYFIDSNTFGVINTATGKWGGPNDWRNLQGGNNILRANTIQEDETKFAGLCLQCHNRTKLESVWTGHGTVSGWSGAQKDLFLSSYVGTGGGEEGPGNGMHNMSSPSKWLGYRWDVDPFRQKTAGYIQKDMHNFSCSKCHSPHASNSPRLLVTNCLDTKGQHTTFSYAQNTLATTCHSTTRGAGWNQITPHTQGASGWTTGSGNSTPPPQAGGLELAIFSPEIINIDPCKSATVTFTVTNNQKYTVSYYSATFNVTSGLTISSIQTNPYAKTASYSSSTNLLTLYWQNISSGTTMTATFQVKPGKEGTFTIAKNLIEYQMNSNKYTGSSNTVTVYSKFASTSGSISHPDIDPDPLVDDIYVDKDKTVHITHYGTNQEYDDKEYDDEFEWSYSAGLTVSNLTVSPDPIEKTIDTANHIIRVRWDELSKGSTFSIAFDVKSSTPNTYTIYRTSNSQFRDESNYYHYIYLPTLRINVITPPPDTQTPTIPAGLSSTTVTTNSISLSWSASTDNVGVAGYNIYQNGIKAGTSSGTTYTATGLVMNTYYNYRVSAYDAAGNESAQSTQISVKTLGDTQAPSVPGSLTYTGKTKSTISLKWNASTDNIGVAGYNIYRGGVKVGTSTTTTYTDSGLATYTTYYYNVSAYDAAGNESAKSSQISVKTSYY